MPSMSLTGPFIKSGSSLLACVENSEEYPSLASAKQFSRKTKLNNQVINAVVM